MDRQYRHDHDDDRYRNRDDYRDRDRDYPRYPRRPDQHRNPRDGARPFDSPRGGPTGPGDSVIELWPKRDYGEGLSVSASGFTTQRPPLRHEPINHPSPPRFSGQKRRFDSAEQYDGRNCVKLFVGSVPRTVTEEEIRTLFEEQGKVLEIALIKDKSTGQQQGFCFIKYATLEEAEKAIRALHNQYTLPGGVSPVQVRYADGERERTGNVEHKLYVGSLNKYAVEREVEEIFAPYGRIDDIYLLRDERKQSKGCGFVKYSTRDSAVAAVNALNGIYKMRGCDIPMIVRFADPKRPRPGEPRAGPGFAPSPSPGYRSAPGFNENSHSSVSQDPSNAWQPFSPQNMGPSHNAGIQGVGNGIHPRSGEAQISSIPGGQSGAQGGLREGPFSGAVSASRTSLQNFNQPHPQIPSNGQQASPLQKSLQPPQQFPPALQQQLPESYFQASASQPSIRPHGQPQSGTLASYGQSFPSQQFQSLPAQFQAQQSTTPDKSHTNRPQPNASSSLANSQVATPSPQPVPYQQSPSQLAQMLSQQTQSLQASFESSQQKVSQLQQHLQMMQSTTQNQPLLQGCQGSNQQSQWPRAVPTTAASAPDVRTTIDAPSSTSSTPAKCNWTEHTSPDGHKYYYNSATGDSRWEKPEELTLYEQQQQRSVPQQPQQKSVAQQPQQEAQYNYQVIPTHQIAESQPSQLQTQFHQIAQSQPSQLKTQFHRADPVQYPPMLNYQTARGPGNQTAQEKTYLQSSTPANSVNDPATFQQGFPYAQDWSWRNSKGN